MTEEWNVMEKRIMANVCRGCVITLAFAFKRLSYPTHSY